MKIKNYMDNFYYVLLGTYFTICIVLSALIIILRISNTYTILGYIFLTISLFLMHFIYDRTYIFEDKQLVIKFGFITKKIKYKNIKKCYITSNNRISFATSKKKIAIQTKRRTIYISPEGLDEFLFLILKKVGK